MQKFHIFEGNNKNYFIQEENLNLHLLLTESDKSIGKSRIYANFAENNSGIGLCLLNNDEGNKDLKINLIGEIEKFSFGKNDYGAAFEVELSSKTITLSYVCMDSIRALRDLNYDTAYEERCKIINDFLKREGKQEYTAPKIDISNNEIFFEKKAIDFKHCYYLKIITQSDCHIVSRDQKIILKSESNLRLKMFATNDSDRMQAFTTEEILSEKSLDYYKTLEGKEKDAFEKALRTLRFLSYTNKVLTGSWNYLTYFGRDTMMTGMMLYPYVSNAFYKTILQAILDRVSDKGEVAHEEDIGDQAGLRHIMEGDAKNFDIPVYDYKMVDDDFMLLPALEKYLMKVEIKTLDKINFLNTVNLRHERNIETIRRNINFVLGKSKDAEMVKIKHETVGNWRDSNIGLANSKYPFDVNTALIEGALSSIKKIINSTLAKELGLSDLLSPHIRDIDKYLESKKKNSEKFIVKLTLDETRKRLCAYLENLSDINEKEYILNTKINSRINIQEFLYENRIPEVIKNGLEFYGVSLSPSGGAVKVINSDIGFKLFFGTPDLQELDIILKSLELYYPLGLRTDVGILTANPVFADDIVLWKKLDRKAYHGSVIWGWQHYLIQKGLMKQIKRLFKQEGNELILKRMYEVLKETMKMLEKAEKFLASELWAYRIEKGKIHAVPYGEEIGSETESNAIQLWSSAVLSVFEEFSEMEKFDFSM